MYALNVKRLDHRAKLPVVAHAGEDLGYDIFALEDTYLGGTTVTKVRTGIAATAKIDRVESTPWGPMEATKKVGLLIRDRSSMAAKGVFTHGGVIDAGYTGEIVVLMTTHDGGDWCVKAGDKIAQMIPTEVLTGFVTEVDKLGESKRGGNGFGSTGK